MSEWLPIEPDSIPTTLRRLPWVLWRPEPRGEGKPDKVPYRIAEPQRRASHSDPATWGSFDDAVEAYSALIHLPADPERGPVAGVGVVLPTGRDVTCLDLDRVIDGGGRLDPRAFDIIRHCDFSWTEISPSGTGLHIFVVGTVPAAIKGDQIEVYSERRYICVTGHQWPGTRADLQPARAYLDRLIAVTDEGKHSRRPWTGTAVPPPDDLAGALLAKLQGWGIPAARLRPWGDGYLVELAACPWADEHTTGTGGAAVMIHGSGAFDFTCLHAHCARRDWREFRAAMESRR